MSVARVLVVDDDAAIRLVVSEALRRDGHKVQTASTIAERDLQMRAFLPDALITDVMLPDGNGLDGVPQILEARPHLPVIVLSAQNTLSTAVRATEQGAFEYLPKPFDLDELCRVVRDGLARQHRESEDTTQDIDTTLPLIGRSKVMQDVYRLIARVMSNDLSVLILGESGTGKELVARAIHDLGLRKAAPFVAINMAAIPRELIEAELFGHEKGAFTGATQRNAGKFELAAGGTLFLDEIGDMPMEAQTRLLRVLQSGEFTTVGGNQPIRADVRIISATHKDPGAMVAEGSFREDLFYRLNVVPTSLPPLRARGDDVALLARHFLDLAASEGLPRKRLNAAATARLNQHSWPGNVRELENLMRRLAALVREEVITAAIIDQYLGRGDAVQSVDLLAGGSGSVALVHYIQSYFECFDGALPPDGVYDRLLAAFEKPLLETTLAAVNHNQLRAAKLLGINRNTLRKKMTDLGIEVGRRDPA
ncbi:MAG: nitrogen regulation protein NR(I) [Alphaproteobacteria bacterium]|nr:nitrogen regulation protein NR(I) [Alphaproteobacteria bacterium]MDE2041797.1 nitrogen regulation protein NR(I) [Alphaproteobacteria bacterium]MDE2340874.1 nitrogen regulation protein NR(I) [Alphaproteobacteria bacterium]